jgi:hypothetical protein
MEIYASVAPLVTDPEERAFILGEEDPELLAEMTAQEEEIARSIDAILHDLYYLETDFVRPRSGEGVSEMIGTLEDLLALKEFAAAQEGYTPADYLEGRVQAGHRYNHLINHDECSGYYVPVEFMQAFAFESEEGEISVGSSVALLAELEALIAPLKERFPAEMALALATGDEGERAPLTGPVGAWHALIRLCRSSVETDLPIHIG